MKAKKMARSSDRSTKRALASMLMVFEAAVMFFATLVGFGLKVAGENGALLVWAVGGGLAAVLILTPAILGKPYSYWFGSLVQLAVLLTGIWVPLMWLVGAIFICLWAWALVAGSTIDAARRVQQKLQAE